MRVLRELAYAIALVLLATGVAITLGSLYAGVHPTSPGIQVTPYPIPAPGQAGGVEQSP